MAPQLAADEVNMPANILTYATRRFFQSVTENIATTDCAYSDRDVWLDRRACRLQCNIDEMVHLLQSGSKHIYNQINTKTYDDNDDDGDNDNNNSTRR